jgi:CheY-like chemotaxis protein
MDGFEVLKYIRSNERTRLIPVIILTSSNEEKDIKRAYGFGANSYIRKPVDFKKFHEIAQKLSFYWLFLNENPS